MRGLEVEVADLVAPQQHEHRDTRRPQLRVNLAEDRSERLIGERHRAQRVVDLHLDLALAVER
jgi:hypothetical protein